VLASATRSAMCNAMATMAPAAIAVDSGELGRVSIAVTAVIILHERSQIRAHRSVLVRSRLWLQYARLEVTIPQA